MFEEIVLTDYDKQYIHKERWMIQQIGLSTGTEVDIFSMIYNFSKNTKSQCYTGTREDIADFLNISTKSVGAVLAKLTKEGYLIKGYFVGKTGIINPKRVVYKINIPKILELREKYNSQTDNSEVIVYEQQ